MWSRNWRQDFGNSVLSCKGIGQEKGKRRPERRNQILDLRKDLRIHVQTGASKTLQSERAERAERGRSNLKQGIEEES
jgi:hypothetical protein